MFFTDLKNIYEPILIKEIIGPIFSILISFIVYTLIKKITKKVFRKKNRYIDKRRSRSIEVLINNIAKCLIIIINVIVILQIFGIQTSSIITSLGLVSAVIGLAFQDILKDILQGASITLENQYAVGDVVTINDFKGEVIALGLKTTKIKSHTGEVLIIANHNITQVINHSLESSLALVSFEVAYEMKIEKVEKILNQLCIRLTDELEYIKSEVTLLGISNLNSSGIEYQISVETKPMRHLEVARKLRREIKLELDKHNIEIPYNKLVIHNA